MSCPPDHKLLLSKHDSREMKNKLIFKSVKFREAENFEYLNCNIDSSSLADRKSRQRVDNFA